MKSTLTLSILLFSLHFLFAQDTIKLNSGEVIPAKIITISDDFIEYKKSNYLDGPIYRTDANEVESLNLNGEKSESNRPLLSVELGLIEQERRHFVSVGTGLFHVRDTEEPGLLLKADATYFFSPVFGLGLSTTLFQGGFPFSVRGNSPTGIISGKPRFSFLSEKTRVTHVLVNSTFSIPLKYFSLDYKIPFGYTRFKTSGSDESRLLSNGVSYSYAIDASSHVGYSFGSGLAMRFNLTEKSPITFSFGVDYLITIIKPEFEITTYDQNTNQTFSYVGGGNVLTYTGSNMFIQLTYQINQVK